MAVRNWSSRDVESTRVDVAVAEEASRHDGRLSVIDNSNSLSVALMAPDSAATSTNITIKSTDSCYN